ncbi:ABC transporter [Coccidioides immitis RS]|uniref:ABC transporter n=1 Tax=Coccidioides immitis (strain RS) TaxID=246410 RepID=J3KH77_COCIM|nr:ABC transporter [Coccidioides immitis RS]EAS35179.3 ABC transporter [Coccidioides immitis RS]
MSNNSVASKASAHSAEHDDRRGSPSQTRTDHPEDVTGGDRPTYEAIRTFSSSDSGPDNAQLASALSRSVSHQGGYGGQVERRDTLAGIEIGDPVLDPTKPEFDFYKWARMFMKLMEDDGIKRPRTGVTWKDLNVSGSGAAMHYQNTVLSPIMAPFRLREYFGTKSEKLILRKFNGVLKAGEMLIVLGRPGSGCSTFLKTISGELQGLKKGEGSVVHYNGVPQDIFNKEFRGEATYSAEDEKHFPHLTVGQTLEFAAAARTPSLRVMGVPRKVFSQHITKVVMTIYGLSHTRNTKVGDDYVRGVSGGERKRVSIAEISLAGSQVVCWDNSTRGLDAATALEFTRALKIGSHVGGMTQLLAIYQASQAIYDLFDKAIVLYEGRQIYFGPAKTAKKYFEDMGWFCPQRQTTGDFLTSVTNPQERRPRKGFETKVPRTAQEFEHYWLQSETFKQLQAEIEESDIDHPDLGEILAEQREAHRQAQAKYVPKRSPYTISIFMQLKLCMKRAYQRIWGDKASTIAVIISQVVMSLIIGSIFFGTPNTTNSFFAKGSILFFAILLNGLMSITEINGRTHIPLYKSTDMGTDVQRPIVAKHVGFAFYHAYAEALAGLVADIPIKFIIATVFNIILYFLGGLRREPSQFFIFFLFTFMTMLTMSAIFRTLAAATKTVSQALAFAGVMILAIVIYTGFTIQRSYMHPWFKWISWINPVAYGFESILVNEVHGQRYQCAVPVPPYGTGNNFECAVAGAIPGERTVSGDSWVESAYGYSYAHIWRNLGILFGFMFFFYALYLFATEFNLSTLSAAEYLVFQRGYVPKHLTNHYDEEKDASGLQQDMNIRPEESPIEETVHAIPPQKDVFTWRNVVYDISIKGEPRRLLDNVSGWVRPGTLTALMGVSGAGKTTLLDALAQRTTMGVITGDMLVNGKSLDMSFQRKTGYVQQQDLHLETTTVREALRFSAMLRQPKSVSKTEKYAYVEDVIDMLNMRDFSEAVVGNPGEGLNVEQRKLLTIGVELAAKPALLLFLDEPTSGLDSQSSWSIITFLRKLADNGQAVLSTIHQPSAILFQQFDRLLFLAKGGKTVYFGDIGENSRTLLDYFERNGAEPCGSNDNPAEYMLDVVGAGPSGKSEQDWPTIWNESEEARRVQEEIDRINAEKEKDESLQEPTETPREFAMPFTSQVYYVTIRVFQQYWRTPTYIWGKLLLGIMAAVFIGFSFYMQNASIAGLQNTLFAIFMLTTIFSTLVQQIMPRFVTQRSLFEVRERPSRAYSWQAFLLANVMVEIPYQIFLGVIVWAALYYPVFGVHQSSERQGLFVIFSVQFFIFGSTFAQMVIAGLPDAETAGNIATTLFSLMLTFNGVLQSPRALPGFWVFMWRVSPLTYTVGGLAATVLHERVVRCAENELAVFDPPDGATCGQYLERFFALGAPGRLNNPFATQGCEYCPLSSGDQFLAESEIFWNQRWRNFGIGWGYIGFNVFATVVLYYLFRVRKSSGKTSPKKWLSLAKYYAVTIAYWVRSIFVRRREKTPRGKEHICDKIY